MKKLDAKTDTLIFNNFRYWRLKAAEIQMKGNMKTLYTFGHNFKDIDVPCYVMSEASVNRKCII